MLGESTPRVHLISIPTILTLCIYRSGTLELGLPQIVVVGSQSVGKSSLIENISGVRLELSVVWLFSSSCVDNPA